MLRAIMSDGHFKIDSGELLAKPVYFIGDSIKENDDFYVWMTRDVASPD